MSFRSLSLLFSTLLLASSASLDSVLCQSAGPYGYVSYHSYDASQSMSTVSCSDGSNGMIAKGYSDMSSLYPYVGAASFITWNSVECGGCWTLSNIATGNSVNVHVIDGCGSVGGYTAHFDVAPEAFQALGGSGTADGHVEVTYSKC